MEPIKGILFDVDGTLYHQAPLRMMMVLLLIVRYGHRPKELMRNMRIILAYRKAQETLRAGRCEGLDCADRQVALTASRTRESVAHVKNVIEEWFDRNPLIFLCFCRRKGLVPALRNLHGHGVQLGVLSDYPVQDKLKALGVSNWFSVVVSAGDAGVSGFKPNTSGFAVAAGKMGLQPAQILYVGDRPEVDGAGAAAAGMKPVILKKLFAFGPVRGYSCIRSFSSLLDMTLLGRMKNENGEAAK